MRCRTLLIAACALLSSGCLVVSLQPAYDADSITFVDALVGVWENAEDATRATIERGEWRSYKITFVDHSTTRTLQGNATRIGSDTFLDITELRGVDPGPYLVPVHGVLRLRIEGDTLAAAMLDYNWFIRAVSQRSIVPLRLAIDDRRNVVVTAPTAELRRWLAQAPDEAFSAPMTLRRSAR
ncbi:MAG TPA: hypothetical protein VI258_13170 [Rhodanobacteraceae bacterium]